MTETILFTLLIFSVGLLGPHKNDEVLVGSATEGTFYGCLLKVKWWSDDLELSPWVEVDFPPAWVLFDGRTVLQSEFKTTGNKCQNGEPIKGASNA